MGRICAKEMLLNAPPRIHGRIGLSCWVLFFLISASTLCHAALLKVSNSSETVNGTVSSPAELIANPGQDGISLREAILAANNTSGPHQILLDNVLAGQTVTLGSSLPAITRDSISLVGVVSSSGVPNITISGPSNSENFTVLPVLASNFTISGLRLRASRGTGGTILFLRSGRVPEQPLAIKNIRIENNIFSNKGVKNSGNCITIGNENGTADAVIQNVTIARNQFIGFRGDITVIGTGTSGKNGRFKNLLIYGNTFINNSFPVEIGVGSDSEGGITSGIKILDNIFKKNFQTITIGAISTQANTPASQNIFRNLLISGNSISRSKNPAIIITAGVASGGGAVENAILNTRITNNIFENNGVCAICLLGGSGNDAQGNKAQGVIIANNTILNLEFAGISIRTNHEGSSANSVSGVKILNTIFKGPGSEFGGEVTPSDVTQCITSQQGFTGANGNFSADPMFVNLSKRDYHLKAGSPAINAGTSGNAPRRDFECRLRIASPDIGALEFGAAQVARLSLSKIGSGTINVSPTGGRCYKTGPFFFPSGTTISVSAIPADGFQFAGWQGEPDCADGLLTMDSDKACIAIFSPVN